MFIQKTKDVSFKKTYFILCVLFACISASHVNIWCLRRLEEGIISLELELQMVMGSQEIEPRSYSREVSALNH